LEHLPLARLGGPEFQDLDKRRLDLGIDFGDIA
jgi:hypothetical protein